MIRIMIARITGVAVEKQEGFLIVETGGIGYKVFATKETCRGVEKGKTISLFTHLAVRENALDLYGFKTSPELSFFEQLLTVSGIGPKSALSILNAAPVSVLKRGISMGDTTHLTKVSGIGKKSAEKIVIGLKDKIEKIEFEEKELKNEIDALETLVTLGYREREARDALRRVDPGTSDTGDKVKRALKILGSGLK